jgi:CTP:molybdopterin cytidylyltransferase MocA
VFGELRALRGEVGAREMLQGAASVEDEGLAVDIDTEADVVRVVGLS